MVSDAAVEDAPKFLRSSYAYDLAANADGSTNRIRIGWVVATDPEDAEARLQH